MPYTPDVALQTWMQNYHMALANVGYALTGQYGQTLTYQVTYERTPGWAIVLAILLFPIGLLFLLAKRRESYNATVSFMPDLRPNVTFVTIDGYLPGPTRTYLSGLQGFYAPQLPPPPPPPDTPALPR